jgi:hypothetical protein
MYESFVYQCITKLPLQTSVWNGWSHHGKNQLFFVFGGLVFGKILPVDFRMNGLTNEAWLGHMINMLGMKLLKKHLVYCYGSIKKIQSPT